VQNQGEAMPFEQGTAVAVHLPSNALRVLQDSEPVDVTDRDVVGA
jgi:hypothetical protein